MVDLLKVVVYAVEWLITRIVSDIFLVAAIGALVLAAGWWLMRRKSRRAGDGRLGK
ncbi:MAG: hypothetical protein AB7G15_07675 [Alphaproteobacteria bacterium]